MARSGHARLDEICQVQPTLILMNIEILNSAQSEHLAGPLISTPTCGVYYVGPM